MDEYIEKIETILSNKFDSGVDVEQAVIDVKTWLGCEWMCMLLSMPDYVALTHEVEPIARQMIKEM